MSTNPDQMNATLRTYMSVHHPDSELYVRTWPYPDSDGHNKVFQMGTNCDHPDPDGHNEPSPSRWAQSVIEFYPDFCDHPDECDFTYMSVHYPDSEYEFYPDFCIFGNHPSR